MKQDAIKNYKTAETLGSTQLELILQVYDGALQALAHACKAYRVEQFDAGYNELEKARRFVTHLYTTLNLEEGGEVAANLAQLYTFVIGEIDSGQATKDVEQLDNVSTVLRNVRDGWAELREQVEGSTKQENEPAATGSGSFAASV